MSVISSIIDALRRIGSPTQKAALRRQDEQLLGKKVLERRQARFRGPLGAADAFVATIEPVPEVVRVLSAEEVQPIRENVELGIRFLREFGIENPEGWTLDDLDEAFARWQAASDKLGYSDDFIIEVLGAMFGEYCSAQLNMRWIKLEDQYGATLAIEGIEREFRGFPYQSISKRIKDSEHGFFRSVFIALSRMSEEARHRESTAQRTPRSDYSEDAAQG